MRITLGTHVSEIESDFGDRRLVRRMEQGGTSDHMRWSLVKTGDGRPAHTRPAVPDLE